MDANALLRAQGWQGAGHALNQQSGRGLSQPIKASTKDNVLGIGKRKHEALTDQWWAKAFDEVLQDVNENTAYKKFPAERSSKVPKSERRQHVNTPKKKVSHNASVYAGFVKGESLEGSIERQSIKRTSPSNDRDRLSGTGPRGPNLDQELDLAYRKRVKDRHPSSEMLTASDARGESQESMGSQGRDAQKKKPSKKDGRSHKRC